MTGRSGEAADERGAALLFPFIAIGIVWLYFFAGAYGGVYLVQLRLSSILAASAILLGWLAVAWRSARWRPRSELAPALTIAIAALALSMVASRHPRISLDFVAYGILLTGLYLLLVTLLRDPAMRRRFGVLVTGLAAALCAWYLGTVVADWVTWWGLVGRLAVPPLRPQFEGLTFGNPGLVAAMAVMTALSAVGHLGGEGRRGWLAGLAIVVPAGAVVLISGTRGAWLATALTASVAAVLFATRVATGARERLAVGRPLTTRGGRLAVGGATAILLLAVTAIGPTVTSRILNSGDGGRMAYWAAAWHMFTGSPISGVGAGMWAPERIRNTVAPDLDFYIPHAHNLYLETAAELGVIGLIAGLAVVVVTLRLVVPALRGGDADRRRWAAVAVLAAIYFGIHQMFDLFVGMPAALLVLALPFAWLDATATVTPRASGARRPDMLVRRAATASLPLAIVVATLATVWNELPAMAFARAEVAVKASDWQTALTESRVAATGDPAMAPYRLVLGLSEARADEPGAKNDLETAAALDDFPNAWLNLAALHAASGDADMAWRDLTAAMRLGAQQPALLLPAGAIAERLGRLDAADGWYVDSLIAMPRLSAAAYWRDLSRAGRWASIAATAAARLDPADRVDLWLSAGDLPKARDAAAAIADAQARQVAQLGIAAWGGDASSYSQLQTLARTSPRDTITVGWCARLAAHGGDVALAASYRWWLETISPYSSTLGMEVTVTGDSSPGWMAAGEAWATYGIFTYRRPTPVDLLLPGLPHIQVAAVGR